MSKIFSEQLAKSNWMLVNANPKSLKKFKIVWRGFSYFWCWDFFNEFYVFWNEWDRLGVIWFNRYVNALKRCIHFSLRKTHSVSFKFASTIMLPCETCGETFKTQWFPNDHFKSEHQQNRAKIAGCRDCGAEFIKSCIFPRHLRRHHESPNAHRFLFCPKFFGFEKPVRNHEQTEYGLNVRKTKEKESLSLHQ